MPQLREDQIRERAYYLWERAGSPTTHSQDFWRKAERELCAEQGLCAPGQATSAKPPPPPVGAAAAGATNPNAGD